MKQYSSVIFDLDGTLTRTNDLIFSTFNHVADKYAGCTFTPAEITAMFGPPEESAIERIVGSQRNSEAMADFLTYYAGNHATMASLYAGVTDILHFLKSSGVRMAVFTGKGKRTATITLELFGLAEYFDLVVTGTDVREHKPSPEGIWIILNAFKVPASEVLMVGDSASDITSARGAGVDVATVVWDSYAREIVTTMGADHLFCTVGDFFDWIKTAVMVNGGPHR
jgi:HAD superfamily hydrolase (TIGR01509 family)